VSAEGNQDRVTVGFLLTVGSDHPRFAPCLDAVDRALADGAEVFFYCLDEGVTAVDAPRLAAFQPPRFHLLGCAYAAERRHLVRSQRVTWGGLKMLGDLIAHTGTFQSF
jgi:hypothetical protein